MSMLRFVSKGYRQWEVRRVNTPRQETVIAAITESTRGGLVLTVDGAGLNTTEIEAVSLFMGSSGAEDDTERVRR